MRIAFISDIHGNLPALEAVMARLGELGPFDAVVDGGDIASGGAYPAECVALVRSLPWQHIRGNGDEFLVEIATDGRIPLQHYPEDFNPELGRGPRSRWTAAQLNEDDVEFLANLPLTWECTGPRGETLMLVHATPWSAHPIVWHDAGEEAKRELVRRAGTDALVYGHIHYPYSERLDGKLLACAGSVGAPFDGDTRACFAILTDDGSGWRVEHVRVEYDVEAHARAVEVCGMPDPGPVADGLRSAALPGAPVRPANAAATTEEQP